MLFPIFVLTVILIIGCGSGNKSRDTNIESAEELLTSGDAQFHAGQYEEAMQTYESLLVLHPTSDLHVDTQLKMAETYGKMDKFEDQMALLKRVLEENIIPDYVPQIYIQIGKFYERAAMFNPGVITSDTTDLKTAMGYYERANRYEDSEDMNARAEAVYRLGMVEAKMGNMNNAVLYYETVSNQYPDTPSGVLAKIKLMDPNNTTELPVDEASMQSYYDQIGGAPQTDEDLEQTTESEDNIELFEEEN
jgi:outer membrane protein assembly factor BamD (BamD/ComL family)